MLIFPGKTHGTHSYLSYQEGARKGSRATRQVFFLCICLSKHAAIHLHPWLVSGWEQRLLLNSWLKKKYHSGQWVRLSQDWGGQCQKQSVFCSLKIFSGRMWPCWLGQCRGTWGNSFTTLNTKNISTTETLGFTLNYVPATLMCRDVEVFLQIWNTHNVQMVIIWKLKNLCVPVCVVCFHIYQTVCILRWWKPWRQI